MWLAMGGLSRHSLKKPFTLIECRIISTHTRDNVLKIQDYVITQLNYYFDANQQSNIFAKHLFDYLASLGYCQNRTKLRKSKRVRKSSRL